MVSTVFYCQHAPVISGLETQGGNSGACQYTLAVGNASFLGMDRSEAGFLLTVGVSGMQGVSMLVGAQSHMCPQCYEQADLHLVSARHSGE